MTALGRLLVWGAGVTFQVIARLTPGEGGRDLARVAAELSRLARRSTQALTTDR